LDKQAICQLFDRYRDDVFRLAFSYLRSRPDAEDICQSIFLKLLEKDITLLPGKEKSWLLTATANACKNHLRLLRTHPTTPLEELPLACEETDLTVTQAVLSLPPKYRIPIHLYYFEGCSQDEIAKILRLTRTAVQTRMARGRALLRKELCCNDGALLQDNEETNNV